MRPNADSACERCGGSGFTWLPPNDRYPNGASVPCPCREEKRLRRQMAQLMAHSGLTEEMIRCWSFETFDPDKALTDAAGKEHLAEVKAECQAYADDPMGWLVLCGAPGSGKSHLAFAIAAAYLNTRRQAYVATVPDLLDALRQGYAASQSASAYGAPVAQGSALSYDERFALVREVGLLVLDDLGAENSTDWAAEKLYQIIDYRYRGHLPLVVTTNVNLYLPNDRIHPRLVSRLLDGANLRAGFSRVLLLPAGDYRQRTRIDAWGRKDSGGSGA